MKGLEGADDWRRGYRGAVVGQSGSDGAAAAVYGNPAGCCTHTQGRQTRAADAAARAQSLTEGLADRPSCSVPTTVASDTRRVGGGIILTGGGNGVEPCDGKYCSVTVRSTVGALLYV